jgi:hypothetical protein
MKDERKTWQELCGEAEQEQDAAKVLDLMEQVNTLLLAKEADHARRQRAKPTTKIPKVGSAQ